MSLWVNLWLLKLASSCWLSFVHTLLCYFPIFQIWSSSKGICDAINSIVSHKRGLILVPYDHLSVCLFFLVLYLGVSNHFSLGYLSWAFIILFKHNGLKGVSLLTLRLAIRQELPSYITYPATGVSC